MLDALQDIVDGTRARETRIDVAQSFAIEMRMAVDQSRDKCPAFQVDDFGFRVGRGEQRSTATDCDEASILDGERIGDTEGAIDRNHLAVMGNEIRSQSHFSNRIKNVPR